MIKVTTQSKIATAPTITQQQGSTLIIVMMMVLLLAIIGAIAVRNSQVSLDMTTSSQVNQLLAQSSDAPLAKLDTSSLKAKPSDKSQLDKMATEDLGPIRFLKVAGNENSEYTICYQPTESADLYRSGKNRIIRSLTTSKSTSSTTVSMATQGDENGYCELTTGNVFTSGRKTVASQVAITRPTVNTNTLDDVEVQPLSGLNMGMDAESIGKTQSAYFRVYVTSILPIMSIKTTDKELEECLKLPIGGLSQKEASDPKENQIACLNATDTPINVQVQDYMYNLDTESH